MHNETFVGMAIKDMIASSTDIHIIRRFRSGKSGSNYFDVSPKNKPTFVVNYYDPIFKTQFPYFVHEYCHFKQWQEKTDVWNKGKNSWEIFDLYLKGKLKDCSIEHLYNIQNLEIDCDQRALDYISKYNLSINVEDYIKESNAYIYSYKIVYKEKYFPSFGEYMTDSFLELMPKKLWTLEKIKQANIPAFDEEYTKLVRKLK